MTWVAVALGGALGAAARHAVNHLIHAHTLTARFPWGTLAANLAGCLAIGVLAGAIASGRLAMPLHWREFVFVGLLGGFTTFSTFGLDTLVLARTHSAGWALLNIAAHVAGGLFAVWIGYRLAAGPG